MHIDCLRSNFNTSEFHARALFLLFCHNSSPRQSYDMLLGQNYSSKSPGATYTYQVLEISLKPIV